MVADGEAGADAAPASAADSAAVVTEVSVSPEVVVVRPIAYKLGHGLQKSKFVFSQAELARCMTSVGLTVPFSFYCVGSRGYVGIYFGPWYLVSE